MFKRLPKSFRGFAVLTAALICGASGSSRRRKSSPIRTSAWRPKHRPPNQPRVLRHSSPQPPRIPPPHRRSQSRFDLTQKPGEHPLAPVIRVLKTTGDTIDRNIHDYSCTLVKQERVDGELGD